MPHPDQPADSQPTTDRRTVLRALAIAGVAAPFLAACGPGGSSDNGTTTGTKGSSTTTGPGGTTSGTSHSRSTPAGKVLVKASDVPVGGGVILPGAGYIVTQPSGGSFVGFTNICTHMQCPLYDISDGTINCNCHGSRFSIKNGAVVNGPATVALPEKPIAHKGDDIVAG